MQNIYDVWSHGWNHCEMLVLRNRIGEFIAQTPYCNLVRWCSWKHVHQHNVCSSRKSSNCYYPWTDLLIFLKLVVTCMIWKQQRNIHNQIKWYYSWKIWPKTMQAWSENETKMSWSVHLRQKVPLRRVGSKSTKKKQQITEEEHRRTRHDFCVECCSFR